MKISNVLKGLIPLLLMSLVSMPCDAQFKKILHKVKNASEKVENTKMKSEEVQSTIETPKAESTITVSDKKFKPSAEAIAADPNATNPKIDKGFTKSIGEIHASYEHLDKEMFPYQPYYKYPSYYRMDNSDNDSKHMDRFFFALKGILSTPDLGKYAMPIEDIKLADGTTACVPIDESFRHAFTALYLADPTSSIAFKSYVWVLLFQKELKVNINYPMQDEERGIIDAKQGYMLPWVDFFHKRWLREEEAYAQALTQTNFDDVVSIAYTWYSACESAKDSYEKYWYYEMGSAIYNYIIEKHKDYNPSHNGVRKLTMLVEKLKGNRVAMKEAVVAEYAPAKPLPQGVQVSGEIQSKGTAAAKAFAGANFQKVIFLKNHWETFKEQKYPYRITAYRIPIVVVTKENGKLMQQPCDLQKSPSGNTWNVVAGMSGSKMPVQQ